MNILKALFGSSEESPEEENISKDKGRFELLKYDGVKAARMGQFDYAVKCYRSALALHDDMETRDYLAQALLRTGQLRDSLEQYSILAASNPENVLLKVQMAHVAYMMEDYDLMAELAEQAVSIDGQLPAAHYVLAQARIGQGDLIMGIAQLTKAIALDETQGDARLLRGQTLLRMGDVDGAAADADYLIERLPEHEDVLLLKARVLVAQGKKQEAITIYNKVEEVNPFCIEVFRERGSLYFELGQTVQAKEDADKVLELDPQAMADVSGEYSAEGIEQRVKQAYSNINPLGL